MFAPFQKVFKNFVDLEVRKGLTGGSYCVAKVKLGSLPKRDLEWVLAAMHTITEETPQISTKTPTTVPIGYRKIPVETQYVSV